jgi:long-chain acyl-CoA synthetase
LHRAGFDGKIEAINTIIEAVAERAGLHPDRPALIAGSRIVTYGRLWNRASAAAAAFGRAGVEPGDRILLAAPSSPAFAYGYLGAHLRGAVTVPLDPHAPLPRREELVRRAAPTLAFGPGFRDLEELESIPDAGPPASRPGTDSPADLLFTTGTTGRPKGVRLLHRNLAAAARHINAVIGIREEDVEVVPLPLYHSFGLGRLRCALIAGATLVLVDGFKLPGEIFSALDKHRATGLVGVPAGFAVLLRFGARGLGPSADRLRYVEIGSAPMPLAHKKSLMELLPRTELWMHYGLTEASRSAFIEFHRHKDRLETIGKPAPGVRLQVRSEEGSELGAGQSGVLWISGGHVSPGYWDDAELESRVHRDGWLCTGDVAEIGADGFVTLHGRRDDMINVGGYNVSPDEVERVLEEHPGVREAACVGMADPRQIAGQVVLAFLVRKAGGASDADLSSWVSGRLETYKVPVQYRWVDALPRTASGKLVRAKLRTGA